MELQLKIIGVLLIILAMIHFFFPRYFNWKEQLCSLSIINRQLMYVHAFFVAFIIFLMGLLCVTSANELLTTVLGNRVSLGLAMFWTVRLFVQFFWYSSLTWKGKRFETAVHMVFSIFWTYLAIVFMLVYLG